jgi:peptidoglycan/xylan/chitin deacetylase (PgdA/CDA1 family)
MSVEEIHALIADGLITVAAHTVSHPALSELDALDYRREIAESAAWCAQFGDAFSGGFAYPYGDCSAAVRAAVAESGLRWAASTQRRSANGATLFDLPRLAVGNWGADDLARAMRFS